VRRLDKPQLTQKERKSVFRRILVPVDLSDTHQQAIDIAAQLANEGGGQVTLLHVVEVIPGLWVEGERDFYDRIEAAARDHLARLGRRLEEMHVPRREEIIFGNRAEEIVRYAMEMGIELIVLSSHRIDLKNPGAGWGTLSYKIGILSQCPVLLVK
jgi:nucleotide-binding universal stress UspA family protein